MKAKGSFRAREIQFANMYKNGREKHATSKSWSHLYVRACIHVYYKIHMHIVFIYIYIYSNK